MTKWLDEKRQVLEASQKMANKGMVVGTGGNISHRLAPEGDRELIAITPRGIYYDLLTINDIQVVDFEVEPVEGDLVPSVETMLHIGIYQARKNVNAVIHSHSTYACAIAVAGLEIPAILDEQVTYLGGEIKLAEYALPGSEELVENVIAALGERNAVLMSNHGVVCTGRTMRESFSACELVEEAAKVYIMTLSLGKVNPLPAEAVEVEKAFFNMLNIGGE